MNHSERRTVSNEKTDEDVEQVRDGECKLKPFVGAQKLNGVLCCG